MRQTTEPRYGNDSAACIGILLDLAASGRSLGQREMSSIIAVVTRTRSAVVSDAAH
jgi:hypothetical protein